MCDSSLQHRLLLANLHHSGCFQGIFQPLQILSIQSKESIRNSSCARRWLESVFQLDYNIYRSSRYSFEFDHLEIVVPQQSCPSTENFACDTRSLLKLKDSRGKRANQTPFPPSDGASFSTRNQWSENNIIQGDVDSRHVIRRRSGSLHFFFQIGSSPFLFPLAHSLHFPFSRLRVNFLQAFPFSSIPRKGSDFHEYDVFTPIEAMKCVRRKNHDD